MNERISRKIRQYSDLSLKEKKALLDFDVDVDNKKWTNPKEKSGVNQNSENLKPKFDLSTVTTDKYKLESEELKLSDKGIYERDKSIPKGKFHSLPEGSFEKNIDPENQKYKKPKFEEDKELFETIENGIKNHKEKKGINIENYDKFKKLANEIYFNDVKTAKDLEKASFSFFSKMNQYGKYNNELNKYWKEVIKEKYKKIYGESYSEKTGFLNINKFFVARSYMDLKLMTDFLGNKDLENKNLIENINNDKKISIKDKKEAIEEILKSSKKDEDVFNGYIKERGYSPKGKNKNVLRFLTKKEKKQYNKYIKKSKNEFKELSKGAIRLLGSEMKFLGIILGGALVLFKGLISKLFGNTSIFKSFNDGYKNGFSFFSKNKEK